MRTGEAFQTLRQVRTMVLDKTGTLTLGRPAVRGIEALAFAFNGIGIPAATTGMVYPVWAMVAMAASVTAIFANSIGARPTLLRQAISSVGRNPGREPAGTPAEASP